MKRPFSIFTVAALIVTLAPGAFPAPFNPKDVAADPAILVHLDCDTLRASSIGQTILSQPDVQNKLAAVTALFDFDLRTQLHGLTVCTTETHPKDGALIVYADFDPNRLIAVARSFHDFQCVTNDSHVIYSWLDDKKKTADGQPQRTFAAILGHRVVFGQDESHLGDALEVIDGKAPDFSAQMKMPELNPGEFLIAQGFLHNFDFLSNDQNAAIFKTSKSVHLKVSEMAGNITAVVNLKAADSDTATQISAIARGLLAVLELQKNNPNALKLANAADIKQDGPVVTLTISIPSSDLVGMIKERQRKAAEKKQETNSPAENN